MGYDMMHKQARRGEVVKKARPTMIPMQMRYSLMKDVSIPYPKSQMHTFYKSQKSNQKSKQTSASTPSKP